MSKKGMTVELVAGTAKMRIGVCDVHPKSPADASDEARKRVRALLQSDGYRLSEPEPEQSRSASATTP